MGFLDALLGKRKLKGPAPDRLFAITTAYVDARGRSRASRRAARRRSSSSRWRPATSRRSSPTCRRSSRARARRPGSTVETEDDEFGYRWMILRDPDIEDLAVGINAVSDALAVGGYDDRVLAAVFAFEDADGNAGLPHLQLQARHLVPVRARGAATSSATPSASCRSRRPSGPSCPSSPSSSAGSPCGGSRSSGSPWDVVPEMRGCRRRQARTQTRRNPFGISRVEDAAWR